MHQLTVLVDDSATQIEVPDGANLRQILLKHGFNPYGRMTRRFNCKGNGICATCGVIILEGAPRPRHWHDKLAKAFFYPRLSCKIEVQQNMTIRLMTEKVVWGKRNKAVGGYS